MTHPLTLAAARRRGGAGGHLGLGVAVTHPLTLAASQRPVAPLPHNPQLVQAALIAQALIALKAPMLPPIRPVMWSDEE